MQEVKEIVLEQTKNIMTKYYPDGFDNELYGAICFEVILAVITKGKENIQKIYGYVTTVATNTIKNYIFNDLMAEIK